MVKSEIEQILKESFNPSHLNVIDDSHQHIGHAGAKEGGHYTVEITSLAFEHKTRLETHRMIYTALEPIKKSIHALAIKAKIF